MFLRSIKVKRNGFKEYFGSPQKICEQVIADCWNNKKEFFQTSAGHFSEFYCRDFGMCAESLVKLGHRTRVIKTLDYALNIFVKHDKITSTISPKDIPFNFPIEAADSLPFLIHAIKVSNAREIINKYWFFLDKEINHFFLNIFDQNTSLIRKDKFFSSAKDYALRPSPTYSNSLLFMLQQDLAKLKLFNPFHEYDIRSEIWRNLWTGEFFYEDLNKHHAVTGDANIFPFWCGVFSSKEIFASCFTHMQNSHLTKPFPLKYNSSRAKCSKMHLLERFAGDYERDSIFMHISMCFMDVLKKYDKKLFKEYSKTYGQIIKHHKNFLEIYNREGKPFKNFFYITDESMIWASKYLALAKK